MRYAIQETNRRRAKQMQYNAENGITPETIVKPVDMALAAISEADYVPIPDLNETEEAASEDQLAALIARLEEQMREAAKQFEFEKAAQLRDRIKALKERDAGLLSAEGELPAQAPR
jgi:excinuclease ABC subunit B